MKSIHIYLIIISIALFCYSCKRDTVSKLFIENLKSEYNFDITDEETTFIIYIEKGCDSCNKGIEKYLNNNNLPANCYIIYIAGYPKKYFEEWKTKFTKKIYLDRSYFLSKLDIDLNGSGKIVVKNKRIIESKTYNPLENNFEEFLYEVK